MNRRTESERFYGPARQMGQNCRRHSQSYVEDDFGADNAAGHKISRLNTEAFFRRSYMQNKPNLCVFWAVSGDCEEKQTQSNPISNRAVN